MIKQSHALAAARLCAGEEASHRLALRNGHIQKVRLGDGGHAHGKGIDQRLLSTGWQRLTYCDRSRRVHDLVGRDGRELKIDDEGPGTMVSLTAPEGAERRKDAR